MINVIPAIDIIDGKCVRLERGDYNKMKVYHSDPLEVAKRFEAEGITNLHLVDLDGAKAKHVVNIDVLERIATKTNLLIDFGGGIKSHDDFSKVFNAGAQWADIGSVAITDPLLLEQWIAIYGKEKIILCADVKDNNIAIAGWQETTSKDIFSFIEEYKAKGIKYILCTDISRDGMMEGAANDLYLNIKKKFIDIYLIASGGIKDIDCINELDNMGIDAVVVGKAIYEGKIDIKEIARKINKQ